VSELSLFPSTERPVPSLFATVAPEVPVGGAFTYAVLPEHDALVQPGVRVKVPFGGRTVRGFVLDRPATSDVKARKLKSVVAILDDGRRLLADDVLALARFAANYYNASLGEVLSAAVPSGVGTAPRQRNPRGWVVRTETEESGRIGKAQRRGLDALSEGPISLSDFRAGGVSAAVLKKLEERGFVEVLDRDPREAGPLDTEHELTDEQRLVLTPIYKQIEAGEHSTTLLHGVTGSGKTEVYLRAIARVLEAGRSAIVLVPEISLTPQTVYRFRARFGDRVGLLHSRQSTFDRRSEWLRIQAGEATVVIGPRSAVWAPVKDLGLIVVDEEHESTYKQDSNPRYNARDLAVVRGKQANTLVILGSATPSLESYNNAIKGRYRIARLLKRPGGSTLPEVQIVDMGREWADVKGAPLLSRVLVREMNLALDRREQVLLFQNRRGYTTYMMCTACGHVLKCRQCDISLTYHRTRGLTLCHFCDHHAPPPSGSCPACLGPPLKQRGAGTERIVEIVQAVFPNAAVGRLDTDVVRGGCSSEEVLDAFRAGELSVLVGTQMIAKGLDIPNVTVVGVISADSSLNLPDFRAAERTFQLIAQVAGRAGRGDRSGRTIVQSFLADHFAIRAAAQHDYNQFAQTELQARKALAYPPYARVLKILFRGRDEGEVETEAASVVQEIRDAGFSSDEIFGVLGPAPSPRAYLAGKFRWQALIKGTHPGIRRLIALLTARKRARRVDRVLDVDPFHLL
jgi:primosomal protein N' (replication factor Y) (superfamily II helicase)